MKITIDIDEEELGKRVFDIVVQNTVDNVEETMFGGRPSTYRHIYVDAIKDAVRETVKKHADDIINRAVDAGGLYIGKKGLKKMIDEDML